MFLRIPFLLVNLHILTACAEGIGPQTVSHPSPQRNPVRVIDASHQFHGDTRSVIESIASEIRSGDLGEEEELTVDVTSSFLGNDGVKDLMSSVVSKGNRLLRLVLRNCGILGDGASCIFDELVNIGNSSDGGGGSIGNSTSVDETTPSISRDIDIISIDLSFNNVCQGGQKRSFSKSLRQLIESGHAPQEIRLDRCGLDPSACRAIGKGIITLHSQDTPPHTASKQHGPHNMLAFLSLSGNPEIGDTGCAALAAALRTVKRHTFLATPVIHTLDLSFCNIGDTGAKALALALSSFPGCVRRLNLAHNDLSDEGVAAISHALSSNGGHMDGIDFSNNPRVGDKGASSLAAALECGAVSSASMRCCSVRADGAMAFGRAVCYLSSRSSSLSHSIDLSGNPLGILKLKSKSESKYSASLLKSKASKTTASYMNFIGKKFKTHVIGNTAESDDDMEEEDASLTADNGVTSQQARCGVRSFTDPLVMNDKQSDLSSHKRDRNPSPPRFELGFRHCALDEGAVDALAAAVLRSRQIFGTELIVDVSLNSDVDEMTVAAFATRGDPSTQEKYEEEEQISLLEGMAQRHFIALEALQVAHERAVEATNAAAKRADQEAAFGNLFGDDSESGYDFDVSEGGEDNGEYYDREGYSYDNEEEEEDLSAEYEYR